jgi:alpha-tubulin suppressor-like RCC1 family protein/uncharacterized protein YjdB
MSRLTSTSRAALLIAACLTSFAAACGGSDPTTGIGSPNGGTGTPNGGTGGSGTPSTAAVATVSLTPATATVTTGRTAPLSPVTRDAAGNVLTGRTITWRSSADSIARVDAQGVVTGVAIGAATITATSEGQSATASIAVQAVPVATVAVTPATSALKIGESTTLSAATLDDAGNALTGRVVRWSTSAPNVATVDSATGIVRAVGVGAATVSATSEGKSGSASIVVTAPVIPVATVSVFTALDTVEAYDVIALQAVTRDAQGGVLTGRVIRWTSSNPAVATVDSVSGALTGLDRGTVTVTATSEGKSGTASRVVVIKYRSIATGTMHACDIASGGIVWCWGLNGNEGRIGSSQLGSTAGSSAPVRVPNTGPGATRFAQLSTYGTTTCGLAIDGKAWCWGTNSWSALGNANAGSQSSTPVAVAGGLTYKQISVGGDHSCALTTSGEMYCWGHNDSRQFASTTPASSATPIAVAPNMTFQSLAAASSFTCGVTTGGAAYCWGYNGLGQLGDGGKISYGNTYITAPVAVVGALSFRSIDGGNQYACALTPAGRGYCWGGNGGKLGDGPTGVDTSSPVAVSGGLTFNSLSTGGFHACGVAIDASLWCWGANKDGQLGNSIQNGSTAPVRAAGSLSGAEISAAGIATGRGAHTCAIGADRLTSYCWGLNDAGQLGNGSTNALGTSIPSIVVGQKPL